MNAAVAPRGRHVVDRDLPTSYVHGSRTTRLSTLSEPLDVVTFFRTEAQCPMACSSTWQPPRGHTLLEVCSPVACNSIRIKKGGKEVARGDEKVREYPSLNPAIYPRYATAQTQRRLDTNFSRYQKGLHT